MKTNYRSRSSQQGIALAVSLILLVLVTFIGLASMRGTILQERMSANLYDRELSFQVAETALRAAEIAISNNPDIAVLNGVDCRHNAAVPVQCPIVPANTWTTDSANWNNVDATMLVNTSLFLGTPQYHVAWIGEDSEEEDLGQQRSANSTQYGGSGGVRTLNVYRVTVRSAQGVGTGSALVVLQSVVRAAD